MDFLKHVLTFVSDPVFWVNVLAAIGALKVLARYTPTTWDDKVLSVIEWLPTKLIGLLVKK